MIEQTQKKLREAEYFCAVLEEKRLAARTCNPEVLDYHLSAFLSAARSVTFALQAEEKDRYDRWFQNWLSRRTPRETRSLNMVKSQRNLALKVGAPDVAPGWTLVPEDRWRVQVPHRALPFPNDITVPTKVGVPTLVFTVDAGELAGRDVVAACKECVAVLTSLVRDFITDHT